MKDLYLLIESPESTEAAERFYRALRERSPADAETIAEAIVRMSVHRGADDVSDRMAARTVERFALGAELRGRVGRDLRGRWFVLTSRASVSSYQSRRRQNWSPTTADERQLYDVLLENPQGLDCRSYALHSVESRQSLEAVGAAEHHGSVVVLSASARSRIGPSRSAG